MNKRVLTILLMSVFLLQLIPSNAGAKKLISEAKTVIQGIQGRSTTLSDHLKEFHQEFSARASKMIQLETAIEELVEKGYLGKNYADSPEKYERVYAEYARHMAEIKDVFTEYAPRIQSAVASFNRSIYQGRDHIGELRSDDMAVVDTELRLIKDNFQALKRQRTALEKDCSSQNGNSRNCRRQWADYQRQLRRIKRNLIRLQYMKKMADIKNSISDKLSRIIGQYMYKETDTVEMLLNYAFNFEQYAGIIGSKDLGGMLRTVRELGKMTEKIGDFEKFQAGLGTHVEDMGNLVGERLDYFMQQSGMPDVDVESRSDVLNTYDVNENNIEQMIRSLEKDV